MIELDDRLRERIISNLTRHERLALPLEGRRHAAVAILLVDSVSGSDSDDSAAGPEPQCEPVKPPRLTE